MGGQDLFGPKADKLWGRRKTGTGQGKSKQEKLQTHIFGGKSEGFQQDWSGR